MSLVLRLDPAERKLLLEICAAVSISGTNNMRLLIGIEDKARGARDEPDPPPPNPLQPHDPSPPSDP